MNTASELIKRLNLQPHPEGGWFREVHRSTGRVDTPRGPRAALTTIYYLLEQHQISRWHVVKSDEIWHYFGGAPLELLVYQPDTRSLQRKVLSEVSTDHEPIGIVRAGEWQAARSLVDSVGDPVGAYSLVGCNVGPGFDFEDFRFVSTLPDHQDHFAGELARHASLL